MTGMLVSALCLQMLVGNIITLCPEITGLRRAGPDPRDYFQPQKYKHRIIQTFICLGSPSLDRSKLDFNLISILDDFSIK